MSHPVVDHIRAHHFGVSVPDLDAAIEWYRHFLGFELERRQHIAPIPADLAFMRCGDFRIEIFQVGGAASLPPERRVPNLDLKTHGNKHMCFEVASVAAATSALRAAGGDIAFEVEVDGALAVFIRDCAGNLIELVEPFREDWVA
ncbi:MAG TPA: VOC family protein [Burkholderiaceae bacterium]|nr:VOC family protein [Burkholderiaceae bacterium]